MKKIILILISLLLAAISLYAQSGTFYALGQGITGSYRIRDFANINDDVYITGDMMTARNSDGTEVDVVGIARFNNGNYYPLAGGIHGAHGMTENGGPGGTSLLVLPNGHLAVASLDDIGALRSDGTAVQYTAYFAIYDPNNTTGPDEGWYSVGIFDSEVWGLALDGNYLIIVGYFTSAWNLEGGASVGKGIVKLNLTTMHLETVTNCDIPILNIHTVLPGDEEGILSVLPLGNDEYLIGGDWEQNIKDPNNNEIPHTNGGAKISLNNVSALAGGIDGYIHDMTFKNNNTVFIAGVFSAYDILGNVYPNIANIAEYDIPANAWLDMGIKPAHTVKKICFINNELYMVGPFDYVEQNNYQVPDTYEIAKYNLLNSQVISVTDNPPYYDGVEGVEADVTALYANTYEQRMYVGGNFTTIGGTPNTSGVSYFIDNTNPLPVELTTFSAAIVHNKIQLSWTTATEVNNYGFEIEKSNSKINWQNIGFVKGNGNSNAPKHYSFTDKEIGTGKYFYRLKQIDIDGKYKYSQVVELDMGMPKKYDLSQNYPNPFNPETTIKYSIPQITHPHQKNGGQASRFAPSPLERGLRPARQVLGGGVFVTLKVYDVLGKEIATLVNKKQASGNYTVNFNAANLPSGIYFYRLTAGSFTETKKMILMR